MLSPQIEGGYTVTCPMLPELLTEGDSLQEALDNVPDALAAAIEIYQDLGKPLPANLTQSADSAPVWFEYVAVA